MRFNLSEHDTRVAGRVFLYTFNAINDARIAQSIIAYLNDPSKEPDEERARALVSAGQEPSPGYLVGLAHCEYNFNGLVDLMYGRWIMKNFFRSGPKAAISDLLARTTDELRQAFDVDKSYQEYDRDEIVLLQPLADIYFFRFRWVERFIQERLGRSVRFDKKDIVRAALTVQEQNVQHNQIAARQLRGEQEQEITPKVAFIRRLSGHFSASDTFIQSCQNTLDAASRWDKLFSASLTFHKLLLK